VQGHSYDSFLCDDEFRPRVAIHRTDDQGYDLFSLKASGEWELLDRFNYEDCLHGKGTFAVAAADPIAKPSEKLCK
jgi:hypothetical protein